MRLTRTYTAWKVSEKGVFWSVFGQTLRSDSSGQSIDP